jgi:kynurenine formamidase
MHAHTASPDIATLLQDSPTNWGRWGPEDEIGMLNAQTPEAVLRGVQAVRSGRVFALGIPMGRPAGDPVWPGRPNHLRFATQDHSDYLAGKEPLPGGGRFADDYLSGALQASTHMDAIGHMWSGERIYNDFDARSTAGALERCGVDKIARHGLAGRGVLVDVARHQGRGHLEPNEPITLRGLLDALEAQGVTVERRDHLVLRTGMLSVFYDEGPDAFYGADPSMFAEPGLQYSPELVEWFREREILSLSTDTLANEVTYDPETQWVGLVHQALMVRLGVIFSEINWLEDLAADCAADGQWDFLFTAGPIQVVGASGAPVNPIAIK